MRREAMSRFSSAASLARPMKLVAAAGRLFGTASSRTGRAGRMDVAEEMISSRSASPRAPAVGYLRRGSFSIARATSRSKSYASSTRKELGGAGSVAAISWNRAIMLGPWNGCRPVAIS
jgi:hypothetical protein